MLSKHDEIFYPNDVFFIVNVLFLGPHQDVDLVESQLHVFLLGLYDLYRHRLFVLVIVRFDHLPEGSAAQTFH